MHRIQIDNLYTNRSFLYSPEGDNTLTYGIHDNATSNGEAFFYSDKDLVLGAYGRAGLKLLDSGLSTINLEVNGPELSVQRSGVRWIQAVGGWDGNISQISWGTNTLGRHMYLTTDGNLFITGSYNPSDIRIKTNIQEIDDNESLDLVRNIQAVKYNYIDTESRGTDMVYGWIAQDVQSHFPAGVEVIKEIIPNILSNISISNDLITFEKDVSLLVNDRIQLKNFDCSGDYLKNNTYYTIVQVLNGKQYKIDKNLESTSGFCVGKEIDDFLYLKKDKLTPILWSGVQQLDKQFKVLTEEKDALQTQVTTLETQVTHQTEIITQLQSKNESLEQGNITLNQKITDMEARLALIESKLVG